MPNVEFRTTENQFKLGAIVITPNALLLLSEEDFRNALQRHANADWGNLCPEDAQANDRAMNHNGRLLSAYNGRNGTRFWIITQADRSATMILLPEEY